MGLACSFDERVALSLASGGVMAEFSFSKNVSLYLIRSCIDGCRSVIQVAGHGGGSRLRADGGFRMWKIPDPGLIRQSVVVDRLKDQCVDVLPQFGSPNLEYG